MMAQRPRDDFFDAFVRVRAPVAACYTFPFGGDRTASLHINL